MNWNELNDEAIALLQGKTPDQIIAWVNGITDLDSAKAVIMKLALVLLWSVYNQNFSLGDKADV